MLIDGLTVRHTNPVYRLGEIICKEHILSPIWDRKNYNVSICVDLVYPTFIFNIFTWMLSNSNLY